MRPPLVSVVVPAFNLENYLQETLASLSAQSEKRFEVLVVDDASSDATPDLVEHWAATDPRIRLIRHGERKGVSAARNRALSEAVGDYVLFVDGETWFERTHSRPLHNRPLRTTQTLPGRSTGFGIRATRFPFAPICWKN